MSTTPLPLKTHLAGNPTQKLQFAVNAKTTHGEMELGDPRATRALVALMDMYAVLGGAASHYGGPAAFAELMSAMHGFVFAEAAKTGKAWHEMFHLINDAGHCENGIYALKANYGFAGLKLNDLKKFRSVSSPLTGHGEAHLFPQGVLLSNGPLGSAFPQSQGLAMGDALAGRERVTLTAISDGGCMEGEAREAMAAIPGLAKGGKLAPFVLIISDNNTKLSGRIDQESFSMAPTFASMSQLGWKVIELKDGHNLSQCYDTIAGAVSEARANPRVPIAIHARTIKGIGTKKTAESASGGHGFPLKGPSELSAFVSEIYGGEKYPSIFDEWIADLIQVEKEIKARPAVAPVVPGVADEKIQTGISAAMVKMRKQGFPVVSVTSDLPGSTGVAGFRKEFPADSFDVGIAESNMVSAAAGMSRVGFIPVVDTFAQFGVTKGALPLIMAGLSEAPMIAVFSHTGFQDAADGASHQALSWLAMTSSIQNVDVYALTCSEEAEALMTQTIQEFASEQKAGRVPRSTVFFLGRENFPKHFVAGANYQLRKAQIIHDSTADFKKCVTLIGSGSLLGQALVAARKLETDGVGSIVINPAIHNRVDVATIHHAVEKTGGRYLIVEDHQEIGGLGHMLTAELTKFAHRDHVRALGVKGLYGQSAYTAQELYSKHSIDDQAIVRAVKEMKL